MVTHNTIDYSGAVNLGEDMGLIIFKDSSNSDYANDNFDYLIVNGSASTTSVNGVRNFLFSELNDNYLLKVGIIPKKIEFMV